MMKCKYCGTLLKIYEPKLFAYCNNCKISRPLEDIVDYNTNENKKWICVTKCPELDYYNAKHCVTQTPNNPFPLYDYDCPCGNCPKWEEIKEDSNA